MLGSLAPEQQAGGTGVAGGFEDAALGAFTAFNTYDSVIFFNPERGLRAVMP